MVKFNRIQLIRKPEGKVDIIAHITNTAGARVATVLKGIDSGDVGDIVHALALAVDTPEGDLTFKRGRARIGETALELQRIKSKGDK